MAESQPKQVKVDLFQSKMWSFNLEYTVSTQQGAEPVKKHPVYNISTQFEKNPEIENQKETWVIQRKIWLI